MSRRNYYPATKKAVEKTKIKGRFVRIANCILNCDYIEEKHRATKLVYLYIVSSGGALGEARGVSLKKIASNLHMSTDFISRCTSYLCSIGLLQKGKRDRNGILTYFLPVQRYETEKDVELAAAANDKIFVPRDKKDLCKTNIPTKFILNHKLPQSVRIVGAIILSIMKGKSRYNIGINYISKLSGFSERHVSRAVSYLVNNGYIATQSRKYKNSIFFIKNKLLNAPQLEYSKRDSRKEKGKLYGAFRKDETQFIDSELEKQILETKKLILESGLDELAIIKSSGGKINKEPYRHLPTIEFIGRELGIITAPMNEQFILAKRQIEQEESRKFMNY